ncbi:hypothetical protein GCM10027521_42180 [Amycolatopsis cihanbeyliensis]
MIHILAKRFPRVPELGSSLGRLAQLRGKGSRCEGSRPVVVALAFLGLVWPDRRGGLHADRGQGGPRRGEWVDAGTRAAGSEGTGTGSSQGFSSRTTIRP